MPYSIYRCDRCNDKIEESWPRIVRQGKDYCITCSFLLGLIGQETFIDRVGGLCSGMFKAGINPNTQEIEVTRLGSRFSWEASPQDLRGTKKYALWRQFVFRRDNFVCQDCGQKGGELNAHHIKPFAKYPKLRFETSNGVTLCVKCHRGRHRVGGI